MTGAPTGYTGPGWYLWSPRPGVAQRIFVGPAPADREFIGEWLAFSLEKGGDHSAFFKRKFADPYLTRIEEGGA